MYRVAWGLPNTSLGISILIRDWEGSLIYIKQPLLYEKHEGDGKEMEREEREERNLERKKEISGLG